MNLRLTQSQALLLQECLKLYNTQLLTSSQDWSNYDTLSERLAGLSDTSRDDDFDYKVSEYSKESYWIDKHNPWKNTEQNVKQRVGKDMDLL